MRRKPRVLAIDAGGTMTDTFLIDASGEFVVGKAQTTPEDESDAFMNSFITQKDASFPSYEHDGPFSQLAQRIQVEQYRKIKTCLGREWFHNHPSALIRAARGMVFLQEMSPEDFFASCRELRQSVEDR